MIFLFLLVTVLCTLVATAVQALGISLLLQWYVTPVFSWATIIGWKVCYGLLLVHGLVTYSGIPSSSSTTDEDIEDVIGAQFKVLFSTVFFTALVIVAGWLLK